MADMVSIMPCLDMQNGRVVKGVHFVDIADAGDPVECAQAYCAAGADALAMLDITATVENRPTLVRVVRDVAKVCTVPFTVGGGIGDVKAAAAVLEAGACRAQIVASGGAGKMEDFLAAVKAGATILLAASVFHFRLIEIPALKRYLKENGVAVRL